MTCHGNLDDHCCYLGPVGVCRYLEEGTVPGRRWTCGLYRRAGSWAAVYESVAYREHVKPILNRLGLVDCGDWPQLQPDCTKRLCCFDEVVT